MGNTQYTGHFFMGSPEANLRRSWQLESTRYSTEMQKPGRLMNVRSDVPLELTRLVDD